MSSVGAAVGGIASGVGSLIGGQNTNAAAADQAAQSEAFSAQQSDTTFQRTVADMKKAGLNPMLAANEQDSSPTGVAAPVINSLGNAMNAGVTNYSALQSARQVDPDIANTQSQTNLNNASVAKVAADTTSALSSAAYADAQANKIKSGALASDVVGSDLAHKGSQWLNNATDDIGSKISDILSGITSNSAVKVPGDRSGGMMINGVRQTNPDYKLNQQTLDVFDPDPTQQ